MYIDLFGIKVEIYKFKVYSELLGYITTQYKENFVTDLVASNS
jgi:hypothetical protein